MIREHEFFEFLDWDMISMKEAPPPFAWDEDPDGDNFTLKPRCGTSFLPGDADRCDVLRLRGFSYAEGFLGGIDESARGGLDSIQPTAIRPDSVQSAGMRSTVHPGISES